MNALKAVASTARRRPASVVAEGAPQAGYSTGSRTAALAAYDTRLGVDHYLTCLRAADPMQLIAAERAGVAGIFVKDLARHMDIPAQRMFAMLGLPKATAEKKAATNAALTGNGGRAALGLARLVGMAQGIVENSTSPEAEDFDAARWLGRWLELPQPALGGRKPAELLDTPTGQEVVARLLGAIESGSYT